MREGSLPDCGVSSLPEPSSVCLPVQQWRCMLCPPRSDYWSAERKHISIPKRTGKRLRVVVHGVVVKWSGCC